MKLTDKEAIKALRRANICELEDMLADFPESDVDGRTDWEMIANEAGWLLDSFNSYGETANAEALQEARDVISEKHLYKEYEIQGARRLINEYNRLSRFVTRLKAKGLYCPYC